MPSDVKFKKGDVVVCLDVHLQPKLQQNKVYCVAKDSDGLFVGLCGFDDQHFSAGRFRLATPSEVEAFIMTSDYKELKACSDCGEKALPSRKPLVAGSAKISEINEAVRMPVDGKLHSAEGLQWDITGWETSSNVGEFVRVTAELLPLVPATAKPESAQKAEVKPIDLIPGDQVVVDLRCSDPRLDPFGHSRAAIVHSVTGGTEGNPVEIKLIPMYPKDRSADVPLGPFTPAEVVAVGRDNYLVPVGGVIGDDFLWYNEQTKTFGPLQSILSGLRKTLSAAGRQSKNGVRLHSDTPIFDWSVVKVLGCPKGSQSHSRPSPDYLYWNPKMSRLVGTLVPVRKCRYATELVSTKSEDGLWYLDKTWLAHPSAKELQAHRRAALGTGYVVVRTGDKTPDKETSVVKVEHAWAMEMSKEVTFVGTKVSDAPIGSEVEKRTFLVSDVLRAAFQAEKTPLEEAIKRAKSVDQSLAEASQMSQSQDSVDSMAHACQIVSGKAETPIKAGQIVSVDEGRKVSPLARPTTLQMEVKWDGREYPSDQVAKTFDSVAKTVTIESEDFRLEGFVDRCSSSYESDFASVDLQVRVNSFEVKKPAAPKDASALPAEPGEGWRFLHPDELVVEGDEFWLLGSTADEWVLSNNYLHKPYNQAMGVKYRRRNKFAVGELVRVVKPLDLKPGPGWVCEMDRYIAEDKVFTVKGTTVGGFYKVEQSKFVFLGEWLAPASTAQKAKKVKIEELQGKIKDIQSEIDSLQK